MKSSIRKALAAALAATLALFMFGCGSQGEGGTEAGGDAAQDVQEPSNPVSVIGAYHPLTGLTEPTDYNSSLATPEEIEIGTVNAKDSESSDDTKKVFVAVEVQPDEKENIDVGSAVMMTTGELTSGAELLVDDVNEYSDNYVLNDHRDYFGRLLELGFHDGSHSDTVYAGADEPYKAIFLFFIGNNDYENGETGTIEWGDYTVEFPISDIQEVETPLDMVAALGE